MASLPLIPVEALTAGPKLVGIAKLAAQGEQIRDGHNVEYFTIESRSILNRCSAKYMPFTWTVNPYRGCEFACKYCYARYTHEFMEMRDPEQFERKIFVKQNTAQLVRRELKKVKMGEDIAIGTATDPYQPAERRYEMTRAILEEMAKCSGLEIGIVTKSTLVLRDIDVLRKIGERNSIIINVTVTTTDVELARKLEPRAPRPDLRLEAVRRLNEAGVYAGVICAPVMPGVTDHPKMLESVVAGAKKAGARFVFANSLFLKTGSEKMFLGFLEQQAPHLAKHHKERLKENGYTPHAYRRRISNLIEAFCKKHGMPTRDERKKIRQIIDRNVEEMQGQLRLFG